MRRIAIEIDRLRADVVGVIFVLTLELVRPLHEFITWTREQRTVVDLRIRPEGAGDQLGVVPVQATRIAHEAVINCEAIEQIAETIGIDTGEKF